MARTSKAIGLIVALTACLPAGGCAGAQRFERNAAADACEKAGYTATGVLHEECVANTVAAWRTQGRQEAQGALLGGLLLGAAVNNARAGYVPSYGREHGQADLVGQQSVGQQRQCLYNTPSGNVTVIVGLAQSCPQTYAY